MTSAAAKAIREYLCFYVALLYFGLAGVLYTLVSTVLYIVLPRKIRARFGRQGIGTLLRVFLWLLEKTGLAELDLSALDALRGEPGVIIAPNHPCLLDAVLVIARVPEVGCIMKAEIQDNVVLGGGARLAGYIRNDSAMSMVRLAARQVRNGQPLLVFPEGTRTRSRPINRFKGAFALIAKHANAPVQTVFIETDDAFLGKGWPLFRKPHFPLVYRVRLGKRFTVSGDVKAFMRELEDYYRQELVGTAAVASLPPQHTVHSAHPGAAA
jgi:1-acyl-sn-glycerol-3-phosphate acyltransferase